MSRGGVDFVAVGDFHDLAEIHDRDALADVLDYAEIVRDE